ncbi:MAG: hypothetical protein AVDCRST_MAG07-276 [uncultured Frankineae bacterium]|uniref:ThuA-like domain-containing protein n=1 Tax=uncultured Frankineae bacterium TaxID=437475 RepID=A0A6J4KIV1_9ACTN|nr:MAG: hypothetical protein AVDCRST_MAG07-276 [uncultured Frankineae bacterium]
MRVLAVTGGHRVDLEAFLLMVAAACDEVGAVWAHAVQPAAQAWLSPAHAGAWDALLLHDLPGLHLERGRPPAPVGPPAEVRAALAGLLDTGVGVVAVHHALAGWPGWEGWATALGGRFHYAPGRLRGVDWPSSGTRLATYRALPVGDHPVLAGVDAFELDDELYCCPVLVDEVVPLLRTDADLDRAAFVSAYEHVLVGREAAPDATAHPPASDLLAWATTAGRSPLVYLQPGDSAATFGLAAYRRLLANALAWVCSEPARQWARRRPTPLPP